ncbi:MAG: ComEA family DNA-binding protein [Actinomycetes bacterium]
MPVFTLTRNRALLLAAAALAVVVLGSRFVSQPGAAPPVVAATVGSPLAAPTPSAALVVDVAGAVRRPGLYRLAAGSRVADALHRAGGVTAKADAALVNLAAPLADGEQVVVPARGASAPGAAVGAASGAPVDLNSATAEQLDALPGIGPVTAQKIVDYRLAHGPFRSTDDLDAIPGIGPSRVANLKGLVVP